MRGRPSMRIMYTPAAIYGMEKSLSRTNRLFESVWTGETHKPVWEDFPDYDCVFSFVSVVSPLILDVTGSRVVPRCKNRE